MREAGRQSSRGSGLEARHFLDHELDGEVEGVRVYLRAQPDEKQRSENTEEDCTGDPIGRQRRRQGKVLGPVLAIEVAQASLDWELKRIEQGNRGEQRDGYRSHDHPMPVSVAGRSQSQAHEEAREGDEDGHEEADRCGRSHRGLRGVAFPAIRPSLTVPPSQTALARVPARVCSASPWWLGYRGWGQIGVTGELLKISLDSRIVGIHPKPLSNRLVIDPVLPRRIRHSPSPFTRARGSRDYLEATEQASEIVRANGL